MKKGIKIILSIIGIILILCIGGGIWGYNYMNNITVAHLQIEDEEKELSISTETKEKSKEKNIENILILGVDNAENASDAIMVLSLDKGNNAIKLTSIMRDTYVELPGEADKINYAYNIGGVELSIAKVNEMFNLDINKYIKVDFNGLANIIDYLGGINISITEAEREIANKKITSDGKTDLIDNSGKVILNGEQALAYSRIRIIDSDFKRTERMRDVVFAMFSKLKNISVFNYPKVISDVSSNITTNLNTSEILNIGKFAMSVDSNNIKQFRVPIDGTTSDFTDGVYHLNWDEEPNIEALHNFIYNN